MIQGLPEKLKAKRKLHGLSQRDLAAKLDLSPSVISSYETGERTPSLAVLVCLSDLYNCSTDYLLGVAKQDPATIDVEGLSDSNIALINDLIKSFRK